MDMNESPDKATLWLIVFMSKSLTNTETQYSNTEREVLGIVQGKENSISTVLPTNPRSN